MIVIKLGGSEGLDAQHLLEELASHDEPWVLVHGGNQELDALTRALGEEPEFLNSPSGHVSRRTTARTIDLIRMSYRGRINNDLVTRLQNLGVNAVGLSGIDGRILRARRKPAVRNVVNGKTMLVRDDMTGRVTGADPTLLNLLLDNGFRPVITIPALAETGEPVNVDGDRAAAAIAAALGARAVVNLSNVPGLLENPDDPTTLIRTVAHDALEDADNFAQGRFKKKIIAAREALDAGVPQIILATANREAPVSSALAGNGTVIG